MVHSKAFGLRMPCGVIPPADLSDYTQRHKSLRRVRARSLQGVEGRVPSRGVTLVVVYNSSNRAPRLEPNRALQPAPVSVNGDAVWAQVEPHPNFHPGCMS